MSSSPRGSAARPWSLRARLLAGQVVVLVVACVGIGVVTEIALHHYLVGQLDVDVHKTAHRSANMYGEPPPPPPTWWRHRRPYPQPGPGPEFLEGPGQQIGMVAAVVRDGRTVIAGNLASGGSRVALTPAAEAELATIAVDRQPVTRDLDGLGRYRLIATPARRGD